MTSDDTVSNSEYGTPKAFFRRQERGRFRDVSVNNNSNRVFFADDILSLIYVCDMTNHTLLFTVSNSISYPVAIHAKSDVVIVSNFTSKQITFYTLEGDLISTYSVVGPIHDLTIDSRGGLNMCSWRPDCVIEIDDSEKCQIGRTWLSYPSRITSNDDFIFVLDSSKYCCHIIKDRIIQKSILCSFPRDVSQVKLPVGMCLDNSGNIVISNSGDGSIMIFNQEGICLKTIDCAGSYGKCVLKSIKSIDISSKGELIVACPINGYCGYVI
ncbi:hypothetical protein LOD99_374 [Oopsacas minuta]|uniref:Uncharacterized protein n=1 Tax=Oopsacas minuta TaxID=111878 RepID=A0AAV7K9C4_9METZ|nr:hypothetical protein LOD99_374 [Oopsacas minuta]